ncbi:MAG: NADH:ubiquinone oxidoreductase [Parcubacteria group bacterium]|nr:NADH:ubiquinone oxidoreductase [Parcubacteria group bacterium]
MKPKVGIFSLTCCEGCEFAILDLGASFLELAKHFEVANFRLIEEEKHSKNEQYDVAFVEGSPITKDNFKKLESIRKRAKVLVVLGNCAAMGGIHQIKNWGDKEKLACKVYKNPKLLDNPDIKRIDELVKVDFTLPGCPITADDFVRLINSLLSGKLFRYTERPICFECQTLGYECLLQKDEVCYGPISQGGCKAVCLKSKQACWGCRGLLNQTEGQKESVKNFISFLKKKHKKLEVDHPAEFFGIKKEIEKVYEKNKN